MPNKSPPEKLFGFIPELSSAPNFCHKFEFEQKVLEEENLASAEPGMIISWDAIVYFLVVKISSPAAFVYLSCGESQNF